jgi:hypothetical protein
MIAASLILLLLLSVNRCRLNEALTSEVTSIIHAARIDCVDWLLSDQDFRSGVLNLFTLSHHCLNLPKPIHILVVVVNLPPYFAGQASCATRMFICQLLITAKIVDIGFMYDDPLNDGHAQFPVIGCSVTIVVAFSF